MKKYLSRRQSRFWSSELPIGDPHGGVAFNERNEPATIVTAVIAVVSAAVSYDQQQQAAAEQEKAQRAQARAARAQADRERQKAVREARIKRGMMEQAAGGAGMGGASSGVAGGRSAIGSEAGANVGYINQQESFAQAASRANQRANDAMGRAATWGAVSNVSSTIFDKMGGWQQAGNLFSSAPSKVTIGGG